LILFWLVCGAGFLLLPLFPDSWQVGLALGWGASWAVERITLATRQSKALSLAASLSSGLLLRLLFLLAGGLGGEWTGAFLASSFLLAFLAGFAVGEPLVLFQLGKEPSVPGSTSHSS